MKLKFPFLALAVRLLCCASSSASTDPVEKDFIYKKTPQGELKLVVTLPPGAKPGHTRPAIVFFSGGAWANSNISQFKDWASYLAGRGMVAVRADYRVSKTHHVGPDQCVEDACSAVRWVREHAAELGLDPERVAASGASAGGHLAACTATPVAPDAETDDLKVSCLPNALVLINCVADLTPGGLAARMAGGSEMARRISPVLHVSTKTPPTLIMDGSQDNWVTTARQFTDKATVLGVRCEFYIAAGEGHQFCGRSPWREATIRKMDEFLISLGWLTGPPVMEVPKAAAWMRYQPDPSAKPGDYIGPVLNRAQKPEADPSKGGSEDKRSEVRKKLMDRKARAPAPTPDDAPEKTGDAPEAALARPAAGPRAVSEQQLQLLLRRFPDADVNKDGKLTLDEFRGFNRKTPKSEGSTPASPSATKPALPSVTAPAGSAAIQISSDKAVPVNPRVYGTWCEEMFSKGRAVPIWARPSRPATSRGTPIQTTLSNTSAS